MLRSLHVDRDLKLKDRQKILIYKKCMINNNLRFYSLARLNGLQVFFF